MTLTVIIVCFWYSHHKKWDFSATNAYVAEGSCNEQFSSPFERRFIMDLTWGNYSFAMAKTIDIVWDTLIGQFGRLIHGYIMYRHVARKLLICLMEYSSVTYEEFFAVQFTQSLYSGICFIFSRLFRQNRPAVWFLLVGLLYMIIYTILFTTIWGAASGYISPSQRTYHMPNDTYVPLNSPHLSLCWKISTERLGILGDHVEIGPDFSMLEPWVSETGRSGAWAGWDIYNAMPDEKLDIPQVATGSKPGKPRDVSFTGWERTIWDDIGPAAMGIPIIPSANFQSIFGYAFTRRMLQLVFNTTGVNSVGYNTVLDLPRRNHAMPVGVTEYQHNAIEVTHLSELASTINFLNFEYVNWTSKSREDEQHLQYFNTWPILSRPASYILDDSVPNGPAIIPYNSTLTFNSTIIFLEAPFMDIGYDCSHPYNYFTALGNCVCYDGVPLTTDWYRDENLVCLDSSIYTWGFSSYLVFVGFICELLWILVALWIRGYCQWWSRLMKHGRIKRAGLIWSILESAEIIKKDLKDINPMEREREIQDRLRSCANICYVADLDDFGHLVGVRIVHPGRSSDNHHDTFGVVAADDMI